MSALSPYSLDDFHSPDREIKIRMEAEMHLCLWGNSSRPVRIQLLIYPHRLKNLQLYFLLGLTQHLLANQQHPSNHLTLINENSALWISCLRLVNLTVTLQRWASYHFQFWSPLFVENFDSYSIKYSCHRRSLNFFIDTNIWELMSRWKRWGVPLSWLGSMYICH